MANESYFEQHICKYIPLDQVIGKEEKVQWTMIPSKQVAARILLNNAKIQYIFFLGFFIVVDAILIWSSIASLLENHQSPFLIFSFLLIAISSGVIVYLSHSLMQLKESAFSALEWFSEYTLTDKRLYLKMTRVRLTKKNQPINCRIRIINLRIIRGVKLYRSFWDRHYKETASFKIRLPPYPPITLHNLPNPETFMMTISNVLNALNYRGSIDP